MIDPTTILVDNLTAALRSVTSYVTLGLISAVSAFVLDRRPKEQRSRPVTVPGGLVSMHPDTAKLVLLGIYFVAGILAYYAVEGAEAIIQKLRTQATPDILNAACTYSSIATSAVGIRVIAALLPVAFVIPIVVRAWTLSGEGSSEGRLGIIPLLGMFMLPYAALGIDIVRLQCPT
jgi:hypothetical protein